MAKRVSTLAAQSMQFGFIMTEIREGITTTRLGKDETHTMQESL